MNFFKISSKVFGTVLLIFNQCFAETVLLQIYDMHCPTCSAAVQKSIERLDGVEKVSMNPKLEQALVEFDEKKININEIIEATNNINYPSRVIENIDK